jgi:hypothetical protein
LIFQFLPDIITQMNIFALHPNPRRTARWHADKHVVKMLLESVQMLYTAHWVIAYPFILMKKGPFAVSLYQKGLPTPPALRVHKAPKQLKNPEQRGYRPVHVHHPCTVWVRNSLENYLWLCHLAMELAREFKHRWPTSGAHSCEEHARWLLEHPPALPHLGRTPFAQAMPEEYKRGDAIQAYRAFYKGAKQARGITDRYTKRHKPHWL